MEVVVISILFLVVGLIVSGVILGIVALAKIAGLRRELESLRRRDLKPAERPAKVKGPAPVPPPARPVPPEKPPEAAPAEAPKPIPAAPGPSVLATLRRDFEKRFGQRWMTWIGGILIVIGMAFFVRHALSWAGPRGRVVAGIVVSIVLLVAGDRLCRRGYRWLGLGLMGTGLGVFYASFYAAFARYDLVSQGVAFAAMAVCTAAGMALAILHDAMALGIIALIGGFLTPILLSTGKDAREGLFTYLLILDLGVLGVAFFKKWLWLDVLAFVGTVALYIGWFDEFYKPEALGPALSWLGAFYLIFLVLPFLYHLRRKEPAPWPRFLMALANAVFGFSMAYVVLRTDHLRAAGFVALGMTACYVTMGVLARRRVAQDFRQPLGFLALAVGFLVLAAPLHFKADGIILAWAIDAPILLYLGYRYRYLPLRVMALLVLALVVVYGLCEGWPSHTAVFVVLFNRRFLTAIAPTLAAAVFAVLHWREKKLITPVDNHIKGLVACAAGVLGLILVHAEFGQWFHYVGLERGWKPLEYYPRCFYVVLWTLGAAAYAGLGFHLRSLKSRITGLFVLAASVAMLAMLISQTPTERYVLFLNLRFVAMLLNVAAFFVLAAFYRRRGELETETRVLPWVLAVAGGVLLLIVLSVESHNFCGKLLKDATSARRLALMAVSVVWGLYAFALLALGMKKRLVPLRYAALGLFVLTALKVVILDTSKLRDVYRWVTYLAIGFLFVAGSYLYYRLEKYLASSSKETSE